MSGPGAGAPAVLGQRLLLALDDFFGAAGLLSVPILYRFRGPLDRAALGRALDRVADRQEGLRTTFTRSGRRQVHEHTLPPGVHVPIHETGVAGLVEADRLIGERLSGGFDLGGLPLTVDLYRHGEDDHVLLINVHHVVTDGWSNMVIRRDLGRLYSAETGATVEELPPVDFTLRDYYAWRDARLAGNAGRRHAEYWDRQAPRLKWSGLRPRTERFGERRPLARVVGLSFDAGQVAALRAVAAQDRATLFAVLLALLFGVLYAATGSTGLVVGSVFANRLRPEVWNTVGPLANLAYIRADLPDRPTFRDLLRAARDGALEAMAHQDYPNVNVLTHRGTTPRIVSRASEVVFNMLAVPDQVEVPGAVDFHRLAVEPLPFPAGLSSHFDLELVITPRPQGLDGALRWADGRYPPELVTALAEAYQQLAATVVRDPDVPLSSLLKGSF